MPSSLYDVHSSTCVWNLLLFPAEFQSMKETFPPSLTSLFLLDVSAQTTKWSPHSALGIARIFSFPLEPHVLGVFLHLLILENTCLFSAPVNALSVSLKKTLSLFRTFTCI